MIYAEDAAHVSGNPGGFILAIRNDSNVPLAGTNLDYSPFSVDYTGTLITIPKRLETYSAAAIFTVISAATDIFTITGSATDTVRVNKIKFYGTQITSSIVTVRLIKRSTANTGGTSTTPIIVPYDSTDPAAGAVVRAYTSNPINGTLVGALDIMLCEVPNVNNTVDANVTEFNFGSSSGNKQPTLRGTSEVLAVNLNGATIAGNRIVCVVEWTESL